MRIKLYVTADDAAALKEIAGGQAVAQFTRDAVLQAVESTLNRQTPPELVEIPRPLPRPTPYVMLPLDVSEYHLFCRAVARADLVPQAFAYSALRAAMVETSSTGR